MIYEPQEDSYLLLKYVRELARGKVIDIGTGSGIQAEEAARNPNVTQVYAVDINKDAVQQLRKKKINKIKTVESDLFSGISSADEKFDVIIFNPPYLPTAEEDVDIALDGGLQGHELIAEFLKQAKSRLLPKGFILMVFSNKTGKKEVDLAIGNNSYTYALLEKQSLEFFEELYVYKISLEEEQ